MSRLRKSMFLILVLVLIASLTVSCKGPIISHPPVIGVATSDTIGLTKKLVDDLTSKATEDGYSIEVLNANGNYDAQEAHIASLIEKPVSVLAICPVDETQARISIKKATDAGIPVVLFERSLSGVGSSYFAGYDASEEGKTAAQVIAENDNGKANIVLEVVGPDDNVNAMAASKGFHDVIDKVGNITVIKVYSNWNVNTAYAGMLSALTKYPNASAIYNSNSTLDASIDAALKEIGLQKKIGDTGHVYRVSVSGSKNGYTSAVDGYIDILVVTDAQALSDALYDAIVTLGSGKEIESTSFTALFTVLAQHQVQTSQANVWGFTTDID